MNGAFFIDKEEGCTSRDVVNEIIKKVETIKVGHTGTLDPMATGVLVVCVGKATKLVNLLSNEEKEYEAEVTLGIETDSYDITGTIVKTEAPKVTKEQVLEILKSFIGEYEQEVPIYSAVKVNGKKLYEYARSGVAVTLPRRKVTIHNIELISELTYRDNCIIFKIKTSVSKGTYIRALVHDIAKKLNTIGVMSNLRRTKLGSVTIEKCKSIDDLDLNDLVPIKQLISFLPFIEVDEILKKSILNGKIIENIYNNERIVFTDAKGDILAIYKVYDKDRTKMKPDVMLGGIK